MNNFGVTSYHPGLADGPIYLGYNATTPVDRRVAESAQPYLTTHFGNPSSGHAYAEQPQRALAEARQQLAGLIGAEAAEIVFTASGSEANNLAIRGTVLAHDRTAGADHHPGQRASRRSGDLPRAAAAARRPGDVSAG
jgi:cysteine desulfurase